MELRNRTYGTEPAGKYSSSPAYLSQQHPWEQLDESLQGTRADGNLSPYRKDLELLGKATHAAPGSTGSIRDQVFGGQLREQTYSLHHQSNLVRERTRLHDKHLKELKHRIGQIQGELSGARLLSGGWVDRDQISLEKLIFQLEKEKRKEDLDFWKDLVELRDDMLENALAYSAVQRRADLFQGLEANYE